LSGCVIGHLYRLMTWNTIQINCVDKTQSKQNQLNNLEKYELKACNTNSLHFNSIQINHQPDATIFQFIILTFIYSSTCFGRCPAHHQELNDCSGNLWFYFRIVVTVVLCSWSGRQSRPRTQHDYHHDTKVKPEVSTAIIELLMMGGTKPETCWAVNKRQDNKLENCCI
jgi:hypothetical protein